MCYLLRYEFMTNKAVCHTCQRMTQQKYHEREKEVFFHSGMSVESYIKVNSKSWRMGGLWTWMKRGKNILGDKEWEQCEQGHGVKAIWGGERRSVFQRDAKL